MLISKTLVFFDSSLPTQYIIHQEVLAPSAESIRNLTNFHHFYCYSLTKPSFLTWILKVSQHFCFCLCPLEVYFQYSDWSNSCKTCQIISLLCKNMLHNGSLFIFEKTQSTFNVLKFLNHCYSWYFLEMHILRPHSWATDPELLSVGTRSLCFSKLTKVYRPLRNLPTSHPTLGSGCLWSYLPPPS